jgi:hypothetical protein
VWNRSDPPPIGKHGILSITDSASAQRFGVQAARLSRAGDNGPDRAFVAPNDAGLLAGVASMVLEPDPLAVGPTAYPLTTLSYAAATPLTLDKTARSEYASFLDYAAGPGQQPGVEPGRLPVGYAPLPKGLRDQTLAAATLIRSPATLLEEPPPPAGDPASPDGASGPDPAAGPTAGPAGGDGAGGGGVGGDRRTSGPPVDVTGSDGRGADSVDALPTGESSGNERSPFAGGVLTPFLAMTLARFASSILGVLALASALAAAEITKRRRRPAPAPMTEAGSGTEAVT